MNRENIGMVKEKNITIGRNEDCPCGSGKKFKQCCEVKGHKYVDFSLFGKRVIIDKTENKKCFSSINEYLERNNVIEYYDKKQIIDVNLGIKHLKTLFEFLDDMLKPIQKVSSCTKGCGHCCKIAVSVTAIEAEMIRNFVINNLDKNEVKNIYFAIKNNKSKYPRELTFGQGYSDNVLKKFENDNISCPFLTKESTCSIYPVRPYACRQYLVFSDSKKCGEKAEDIKSYEGGYFNDLMRIILELNSITFPNVKYTKHIASWFIKESFFERPFHKINLKQIK